MKAEKATAHAIDLEQCALFVDSAPLKKSMTDAAAFLRSLAYEAAKPATDATPTPEEI